VTPLLPQPEPSSPHEPPPPSPPPASPKGGAVAVVAAAGLALAKGKALLGMLKFASFGKFALTSLSMIGMLWYEAVRYGIGYGVGFVALLLVHELGHGYFIKRAGLEAGWPIFIPGFGAMISMRGQLPDADTEARIAYGGPLAGAASAVVCVILYKLTDSRLALALASTAFLLNLFNLIPLSPLDGGRVAQAFSRKAWIFGIVLFAGLFFVTRAPILPIMFMLALPRIFAGARGVHAELDEAQKSAWINRYFGLCVFLALGAFFSARLLGKLG
jgi:Zn-dependent protease